MTDTKNNPQEIDLIELFGNIWNWVTSIFLAILYFFLRNALLFILVVIIAGFSGFSIYKVAKPFYKTELFGFSHTISNVEAIQYINNWNYETEFSDEELLNIKSISAKYVLDLNGDKIWDIVEETKGVEVTDTALINKRMYGAFCIRTELFDTSLVNTIKKKAIAYLENNERVKEMNEIRLLQKKALIPKLEKEIHDLDSLKNIQYFEKNKNTGKAGDLMILNEKDLKLFHVDIIDLYKQQQRIEKELFLSSDPFEITQDFTIPRYQENSFTTIVINYIKYGLLFGFFFILAWDRRKAIIRLFKESSL